MINKPRGGSAFFSHCLGIALIFLFGAGLFAAEVIPSAPAHYFNDYANVVSASTASQLDQKLTQFERDTSNQIVVAIFPKMQSDDAVDSYTVRVARAWDVGQKDRQNGVVLFVFVVLVVLVVFMELVLLCCFQRLLPVAAFGFRCEILE